MFRCVMVKCWHDSIPYAPLYNVSFILKTMSRSGNLCFNEDSCYEKLNFGTMFSYAPITLCKQRGDVCFMSITYDV